MSQMSESTPSNTNHWFRLLGLSAIGIFIFFVPVTFNDKQSIPLDHIVTFLKTNLGNGAAWYAIAMIWAGAIYPLVTGKWRQVFFRLWFAYSGCWLLHDGLLRFWVATQKVKTIAKTDRKSVV